MFYTCDFLCYIATGESTPEHSSSNAEATAMTVVEEDSPEMIHFPEFQNTPVSSAVIYTFVIFISNFGFINYECFYD